MAKLTAQEKEARTKQIVAQIQAAMPSVMEEYAALNWQEEIKGYRTDFEYYPDYIHAPIHGITDNYTNPQNCLAWDTAMDAIIENFHHVSCREFRDKMAALIPLDAQISTVLELGAGTGEGALALARRFPEATLHITDVSPYMLAIAKHKFQNLGMSDRVTFEQVDARDPAYPDNSFDIVTSSLLFHETPKQWTPKILTQMYRITKPGGWVLYSDTYRGEYALNSSFPEPWLNDFIQFNFEYEFAKAGFTDIEYLPYAVGLWYIVGRKSM
jgi:SAM-dependent methyltransferase